MKFTGGHLPFVTLLALLFWVPVHGFSQGLDQPALPPKPTGNSIIRGRVVFTDTGRPARRVQLQLVKDLNHPAIKTTTANIRGEFRFVGVVAGSYLVVAVGSGIVSRGSTFEISELGLGVGGDLPPTRVVVDGKNESRCEVRAVRGASISGVINYSDKEPVKEARILLFHRKGETISPLFTLAEPTNDRGMYRIDGLPAGDYYVGVADQRRRQTPRLEANAPATSFYPGVTNFSDAKPINLETGAGATGINMTIREDLLREVSGVTKWRQRGDPASDAVVTLTKKDEPRIKALPADFLDQISPNNTGVDEGFPGRRWAIIMFASPHLTEVNQAGEWKFRDLPPGDYLLTAYAPYPPKDLGPVSGGPAADPASPELQNMRSVSRQMELTIGEEDLKDIVLDFSDGGRISGVVVVEEPVDEKFTLTVRAKELSEMVAGGSYVLSANQPFLADGITAGEVLLDVTAARKSSFYVKSITAGGLDLMRESLRVEDNAEVTGVRITIAKGLATVNGSVRLKDGPPAAGSRVLMVRTDPRLWHQGSSRQFVMTNELGEFSIRCVPGEYMVFAWPSEYQLAPTIEALVKSQGASARRITVTPNYEQKIELTVMSPEK